MSGDGKEKTAVTIAGVTFKNPVMTASGTFGSGMEYGDFVDLNRLGAVVTKGVSLHPWEGNGVPRVAETPSGMLNAIGLQNPGVEVFLERDLPFLARFDTRVIVNVAGKSIEEYVAVVQRLNDSSADMFEINVSCPSVKEGAIAFGQDREALLAVTKAVCRVSKKPVIMKLSPNVTDIARMAKAAEEGGADAVSLINTLTGMRIDVRTRRFVLANGTGGLSGPAIRPVAVRMVYQCAQAVKIPVIGMGGIANAEDALEFILAGASAVAVGMMHFSSPDVSLRVIDGIEAYMRENHVADIGALRGAVTS